ncbi:MAG: DUF1926 domain-containing protein [Acidobacteria bacterium]|nr:DUF1926 domain-containing protein [Acidobacteriota bacterium]
MQPEGTVRFIFGIHNHQPVGNFPEVIAKAAERAYDPLLAAFERHPKVRAVAHYSGCLLEWLEAERPAHLDALRRLAARGQIEILSGGFYEPILTLIPPADREGQIRCLTRWIDEKLGAKARGMWLAERVWEPGLAADLKRAGVEYTLLDDYHFLGSVDEDPVGGYYTTEQDGESIGLFPISEELRYLIPFREPEETVRALFERRGRGDVVVMMDDGEKYGLWPDTWEWVHGGGWLDRFLSALEKAQEEGWLLTTTFAEARDALPSRGRIYLPESSYFEMGEWSLPPGKRRRFEEMAHRLRDKGEWEPMRSFVKGGFFRSYLARYPESRRSVARGRALSRRLDALDGEAARRGVPSPARRHLWRSQCNCGYWHGLFGGLYLPHIRRAIQDELARAAAAAWDAAPDATGVRVELASVDDADAPEISIETSRMGLLIEPAGGGAVSVLDFTRRPLTLGCTLTRRTEAYHEEAREASRASAAAGHAAAAPEFGRINIHERRPEAPPDLPEHLVADSAERRSFLERFLPADATPAQLMTVAIADLGRADGAPTVEISRGDRAVSVTLRRRVALRIPSSPAVETSIEVIKRFDIFADREAVRASFSLASPEAAGAARGVLFGVELNLSLVESMTRVAAGAGAPRDLAGPWAESSVTVARIEETYRRFRATLRLSPAAALWHHPVRSVSRCESGFELIYQGSAFLALWPLASLARGETTLEIAIEDLVPGPAGSSRPDGKALA